MNIPELMQEAAKCFGDRRFEDAAALYGQVLEQHADHAEALANMGAVSLVQGQMEDAELYYRRSIEAAPQSPVAAMGLAKVLLARGQLDMALDALQRMNRAGLLTDDMKGEFYKLIGIIHAGKKDLDVALTFFKKYAEEMPDEMDPYLCLYNVFSEQGDSEAVATLLENVVVKFPGSTEAKVRLIRLLGQEGGFPAVRAAFDRILDALPDDVGLHNLAAVVALQSGKYAYAYLYYLRASERVPDFSRREYPALAKMEALS